MQRRWPLEQGEKQDEKPVRIYSAASFSRKFGIDHVKYKMCQYNQFMSNKCSLRQIHHESQEYRKIGVAIVGSD